MALDFIKRGILFVIADILSIVTVLLCLVQKLPQIRDVYAYKSAKGKCYHLDAIEIILLDCADSSIGNLIALSMAFHSIVCVFIWSRYQHRIIVFGIDFIHNDDAIQLHLRVFDAIVFGVSDLARPRVYFDWTRAASQTFDR